MTELAHPRLLWLLVPLLLGFVRAWCSRPPAIAVSSVAHFAPEGRRRWRSWRIPLVLEVAAAAALIVALARPQASTTLVPEEKIGSDIVFSLDFSNSMDAFDPDPGMNEFLVDEAIAEGALLDRLGVARREIARFIEHRPNDRLGLVIFGVNGYVVSPPTLDHDYLLAQIEQLSNDILTGFERGTNIAAGIATAVEIFTGEERQEAGNDGRRTLLLITDGRNSIRDGQYTPLEAAGLAADAGITIHAVGIGSEEPYVPEGLRLPQSSSLAIDEQAMERLVSYTDGHFFRADDNAGFAEVMDRIDALERVERQHDRLIIRSDLFLPWILAGFALLVAATLLRNTWLLTVS